MGSRRMGSRDWPTEFRMWYVIWHGVMNFWSNICNISHQRHIKIMTMTNMYGKFFLLTQTYVHSFYVNMNSKLCLITEIEVFWQKVMVPLIYLRLFRVLLGKKSSLRQIESFLFALAPDFFLFRLSKFKEKFKYLLKSRKRTWIVPGTALTSKKANT